MHICLWYSSDGNLARMHKLCFLTNLIVWPIRHIDGYCERWRGIYMRNEMNGDWDVCDPLYTLTLNPMNLHHSSESDSILFIHTKSLNNLKVPVS